MTAPEFLPVLGYGSHANPKHGACVMEYVSILAGEPFTDYPLCTNNTLAEWARTVNDELSDKERQKLLPLIPRLIGTATGNEQDDRQVEVELDEWFTDAFFETFESEFSVRFLVAALDKYDEIAGRTTTGMTADEYAALEARRRELAANVNEGVTG